MSSAIKDISENLGRIFRYILPGAVILGLAYISNSEWFEEVKLDQWWHLVVAAAVTLAIGNTWFVFHRFVVHQVIDLCFYKARLKGPAKENNLSYVDGLARFVIASHEIDSETQIRKHVSFRASSMHLMYITSEALLFFTVVSSPDSVLQKYKCCFVLLGIAGFIFTVWQNNITRRIDWYSVTANTKLSEGGEELLNKEIT